MQKSLSLDLRQRPQSATPLFEPRLRNWFLLDRTRGEQTLQAFYQSDDVIGGISALLSGTVHMNLIDESPLLISLAHTDLPAPIYEAIRQERSGIFFQSDGDDILAHLQYLFMMDSEPQGRVYARYYDPYFWISLQLTCKEQRRFIWGTIRNAFTLMHNRFGEFTYIAWHAPNADGPSVVSVDLSKPIFLPQAFYDLGVRVKLLDLLYAFCGKNSITLSNERAETTLIHLERISQSGVARFDLLTRLIPFCIEFGDFTYRSDVENILQSDRAAFEKVYDLEELFEGIKPV